MVETSRFSLWKEITWRRATTLAGIPWFLLGAFNIIKSEFFPRELQDKLQFAKINPWPWWAWLLMSMAIVIAVTLEGAYGVIRKRDNDITLLSNKIEELTTSEFRARADFIKRSTEIISLQGQAQNKQAENDSLEDLLKHYYRLCGEPGSLRYRLANLAHDIYRLIEEKGPAPVIPTGATRDERQDFIFKVISPYTSGLNGRFNVRFAQKLIWARDQLAEFNLIDFELNRLIGINGHHPKEICQIAERLLMLALRMDIEENHKKAQIDGPSEFRQKSNPLPAVRPKVVPVDFGTVPERTFAALTITNDGEPAYEVSILPVNIGTSLSTAYESFGRLAKDDHRHIDVKIETQEQKFVVANDLSKEMLRQKVRKAPMLIRYRDADHWYISKCSIEIDTVKDSHISVHFDGQELAETLGDSKDKLNRPKSVTDEI